MDDCGGGDRCHRQRSHKQRVKRVNLEKKEEDEEEEEEEEDPWP